MQRSSLIYNTSARHKFDTSDTGATRATRVRHKYNKSATLTAQVQQEGYTNDTSVTQEKNFDFGNDTSRDIFSNPYTYYMASERL